MSDYTPAMDDNGNGYCDKQCTIGRWRSGSKTHFCPLVGRVTYREHKHITVSHMCEMWAIDEIERLRRGGEDV